MPFPTYDPNHIEEGLAKLIEQYKEADVFKEWVCTYLKQVQEFEDAVWQVIEDRWLANSEGVQLDILGKIVGLDREGLSDELYRGAIRVQIRINRSFGTPIDMLDVARFALGVNYPTIRYQEFYPATVKITLTQDITDDQRRILYRALYATKPAGVRLLIEETFDADGALTFNDAAGTLGNDSALALSSTHGPAGTGVFSHIHILTGPNP